ncbi:MAG: acetate kinase [Bacteroidales bacterium]|nr:acetate kinase [Candidatus Cryptobacteroides onthequi]
MIVLVINCGSSSIKYQLLDMKSEDAYELLAKGIVEKIGLPDGHFKYTPTGKDKVEMTLPIPDHKVGMQIVLEELVKPGTGVLESFDDIEAVGHRIVQGADYFSGSALIDEDVLKKIEICCDFAPLHNPAHLLGISAVSNVLPDVPQVAVFDTAFHQTMPAFNYMYGLPYKYYEQYHIRKYGAHGTSHQYVSQKGAELAGIDLENSKIITCHLGNGSSISAVQNGKVLDTSMGFTPLAGMIMGTRCGSIDPNIVPYIMKKEGLSPDEMTALMNKKSGFLGVSGSSSDVRDLNARVEQGDQRAKLVFKIFTYDIIKLIGSYIAEMQGVDLIVFTAGIGENNARLRRRVSENFAYMGLKFDYDANVAIDGDTIISLPDSKIKVAVICTNEELMIARDTMRIVQNAQE